MNEKGNRMDRAGISLPILVDKNGNLANLKFGDSFATHTLITGCCGCGKSTFLRSIIISLMENYQPEDINLWMVSYSCDKPQHYSESQSAYIDLNLTEATPENTCLLLDKIYDLIIERAEIFKDKGMPNVYWYRKHFKKESMPYVIVIVDGLHTLLQHIEDNKKYKKIFSSVLRYARNFGLIFIFSEQPKRWNGLNREEQNWFRNKIAMKNNTEEMLETLDISRSQCSEDLLSKLENTKRGELWINNPATTNGQGIEKYSYKIVEAIE